MRISSTLVITGISIAFLLAAPLAHAFTMENNNDGAAPKFDLEEQMRQFRTGNGTATPGNQFETPYGGGRFEFSVRQGPPSNFSSPGLGSGFSPSFGAGSLTTRQDFERVVTPENLR